MSGTPVGALRRSLSVLCADDSRVTRHLVGALLTRAGHQVDTAETGAHAVALVRQHSYDVVLMDVDMPVLDGLAAVALIREAEIGSGRHVPIVALTAHRGDGHRQRCLAAGMDGYLAKPFDAADLMTSLASVLVDSSLGGAGVPSVALEAGDDVRLLLVAEYESNLVEIDQAIVDGDLDTVSALVHRLKGAIALFHPGEPYRLADRLEVAAARDDQRAAREAWSALGGHLHRLVGELRA